MPDDDIALLAVAQAALQGTAASVNLPPALADLRHAHITLRATGRRLDSRWCNGAALADTLTAGLQAAITDLRAAGKETPSTIELTLPLDWQPLNWNLTARRSANDMRGLYGIALRAGPHQVQLSPLDMLARNLGPVKGFAMLQDDLARFAGAAAVGATRWQFTAAQYLIDLKHRRVIPLFRGQRLVAQSDITQRTVRAMALEWTDWMQRQVGPDGQTTYKYSPSRGEYSTANNMIRQFMGSACLALAARRFTDPRIAKAAHRNFAYNFATFFQDRGHFGVIDENGAVKLGAAGIAVQAICNLADPAPYLGQLAKLRAFIDQMQQPDGSYLTFLDPARQHDNQNFYAGEAMLGLAMMHARWPDPAHLPRLTAAFHHYRDWHRSQRNPAFVPWQTQALCLLHGWTKDPAIAAFVFEMNDWLLGVQQTRDCPPDVLGNFFDPARPEFGPPHASATGVYLEGLIEAWRLAVAMGETARATAYRRAMLLGLRSLRQLQYKDTTDAFYLRRTERVLGGVRTTTYDNTIRLDNVQHGLMAIYKIADLFTPGDYALP